MNEEQPRQQQIQIDPAAELMVVKTEVAALRNHALIASHENVVLSRAVEMLQGQVAGQAEEIDRRGAQLADRDVAHADHIGRHVDDIDRLHLTIRQLAAENAALKGEPISLDREDGPGDRAALAASLRKIADDIERGEPSPAPEVAPEATAA